MEEENQESVESEAETSEETAETPDVAGPSEEPVSKAPAVEVDEGQAELAKQKADLANELNCLRNIAVLASQTVEHLDANQVDFPQKANLNHALKELRALG